MSEIDETRVATERALPWLPIETAPTDGTRVRLHRIGRRRPYALWAYLAIGHYEAKDDGFKGWFTDDGEYHTPYPDSWLPLETDRMQ